MNAPPGRLPPAPITLLHIVGHGRTTLARAVLKHNEPAFELCEDGDGVVTTRSADLPAAYRQAAETKTIETTASHLALWKGDGVEEQIMRFLSSNGRVTSDR